MRGKAVGARGDGTVWNSCFGEGDWEPKQGAGAKNQTAELGLEAAEDPAVFCEHSLQCLTIAPLTFCSSEGETGSGCWHDLGLRLDQIEIVAKGGRSGWESLVEIDGQGARLGSWGGTWRWLRGQERKAKRLS